MTRDGREAEERLAELKQSLLEADVVLEVQVKRGLHDREIRLDNGWVIKIGRGLDFYQKQESWFSLGANDMSLRPCPRDQGRHLQELVWIPPPSRTVVARVSPLGQR